MLVAETTNLAVNSQIL